MDRYVTTVAGIAIGFCIAVFVRSDAQVAPPQAAGSEADLQPILQRLTSVLEQLEQRPAVAAGPATDDGGTPADTTQLESELRGLRREVIAATRGSEAPGRVTSAQVPKLTFVGPLQQFLRSADSRDAREQLELSLLMTSTREILRRFGRPTYSQVIDGRMRWIYDPDEGGELHITFIDGLAAQIHVGG